jgi:hypothetical protein
LTEEIDKELEQITKMFAFLASSVSTNEKMAFSNKDLTQLLLTLSPTLLKLEVAIHNSEAEIVLLKTIIQNLEARVDKLELK